MTDEQILQEEFKLYDELSPFDFVHSGRKLTPQQEKRRTELRCLSMINSILAYDWARKEATPLVVYDKNYNMVVSGYLPYTPEGVLERDLRGFRSYLKDYMKELGRKRVLELIKEQMDSIADVHINTYTDSEGCTYNSIIYKEG